MQPKLKVMLLGFIFFTLQGFFYLMPASATDSYGADGITDFFAGLWSAFWPLIALLFIIGIIMVRFNTPKFLRDIFGILK